MSFLLKFALKTAANAAALWAAWQYIPGFSITPHAFGDLATIGITPAMQSLIAGGLVLAVLNAVLRPVLRIISTPFIFLSFGLFHIVINAVILYIADLYLAELSVSGWKAMLFGSIFIGAVNSVF